jgi:hypothetical protein
VTQGLIKRVSMEPLFCRKSGVVPGEGSRRHSGSLWAWEGGMVVVLVAAVEVVPLGEFREGKLGVVGVSLAAGSAGVA